LFGLVGGLQAEKGLGKMKSERRHELEQNQLADWLAKKIEAIKPYQNWILGALLLLAVGIAWYSMASRRASAQHEQGWDQFYEAMAAGELSPGEFEDLASDPEYEGSSLADWAAVMAGDLRLVNGCNRLFDNKPTANQELRDAVENYRSVLDQSSSDALLQRATFGLARALEAQGNLEKAIDRYNQVSTRWPDGAYAAAATRRSEDLQRESTKEFYDQFAKFEPRPLFSDEPGVPGQRPAFDLDSLSDDPVFGPGTLSPNVLGTEDQPSSDVPEPSTEPDANQPDAPEADPADANTTEPEATDMDATEPDATDMDATETDATDTDAADADETAEPESNDAAESPATGE